MKRRNYLKSSIGVLAVNSVVGCISPLLEPTPTSDGSGGKYVVTTTINSGENNIFKDFEVNVYNDTVKLVVEFYPDAKNYAETYKIFKGGYEGEETFAIENNQSNKHYLATASEVTMQFVAYDKQENVVTAIETTVNWKNT